MEENSALLNEGKQHPAWAQQCVLSHRSHPTYSSANVDRVVSHFSRMDAILMWWRELALLARPITNVKSEHKVKDKFSSIDRAYRTFNPSSFYYLAIDGFSLFLRLHRSFFLSALLLLSVLNIQLPLLVYHRRLAREIKNGSYAIQITNLILVLT